MKQFNFKRLLSGVLSVVMTISAIPIASVTAEENTEPYPYTMFASSTDEGAITINANNVCINGNIASNGTIVSASPNFNVNGTKTENANESMIYIQKELNNTYFSGESVEMYDDDYTLDEININVNNPLDVNGTLEMIGNINLNSGIKALEDISLNGEVKNSNNSVIFSEMGDININTSNTNFSGLIYAPYGDIVIDTDNLNLNNVIIIGQTIIIDCPSINANFNSYIAEFIGNHKDEPNKPNDSDAYILANGVYNAETLSVDIEWFTESEINIFDIWESYDNTEYILVDTVTDANSYQYDLTEDFETKYFKVSFTDNENSTIESIPFSVIKIDDGYEIVLIDTDEDGLADIYEIILGTDLLVEDSDGDNLTDYQEVYITNTDPLVYDSVIEGISDAEADCDNDGLSNYYEIEIGTDPLSEDTDNDNLSDYDEIYVYGTDPLVPDTDKDGIEDGLEIKLGLDPTNPETFGIPDRDYQVEQSIEAENDIFIAINKEYSPYAFSMDITSNNDIEENVDVNESRLLCSVKSDAVLGKGVDIEISDKCSPSKIILNYVIKDAEISNDTGKFENIDRFSGIKKYAVFKYFEEINALLPMYTEYDIANNKIYANVESTGSYFVIDTEKWLDGFGITANDLIYEETTSPMLIKNQSVNILSSEMESSTEKIGKGASGNFFKNEPVDLVFAIQNCGIGGNAKQKFEFEKKLIRDISNYAFMTYDNVRVHLVEYNFQWDSGNATIDGIPVFWDIKNVEEALNKMEYQSNLIGPANRALGHYLSFKNCSLSYRDNSTWFIYNFTNSSTYFFDSFGNYSYDYQSVYDYFWHNGMYYSQVIDGGNNFDSKLKNLIYNDFEGIDDQDAISNIRGKTGVDLALDTTSKNNYNSIIENLNKHISRTSLYGAYSPLDWQKKILAGELTDDKLVDTDKDTLPDWEEVDTSKLTKYEDGSFDLPTINDFIKMIINESERESVKAAIIDFFKTNSPAEPSSDPLVIDKIADVIVNIKILPLDSDPTNPDNDNDGYWDVEDPDPINAPEYLDSEYDFLDNEIYIISPMDTSKDLVLDIDEYLVEEGDQVILSSPDKYMINSKFKFEWCRNGYKICPLEPLFGEDLVLSVSLNDNGTGNVTVEKDSNSDEQLWEIVPYVNKDREIIQQQAGLVIRSKKLYYNKTENRYEPLYLSYRNDKVEVSTERALGTRFKLENIVDDWKRFGSIYTDVVGWTDYPYDYDKIRAMKNYENNKAIGLNDKNLCNDKDLSMKLILNQNRGNFPNLYFADTTMNLVICEVIGTYNAMCISNENTEDVDFFKLAAEFEISARQTNYLELFNDSLSFYLLDYLPDNLPNYSEDHLFNKIIQIKKLKKYDQDGGLGSDPRKIGNCLDAYNMKYKTIDTGRLLLNFTNAAKEQHIPQCDRMDEQLKEDGSKSAIISYTFDLVNIHTFALRYDSMNSDQFIDYNYNCSSEKIGENKSIKYIFKQKEHYYVGYVLY